MVLLQKLWKTLLLPAGLFLEGVAVSVDGRGCAEPLCQPQHREHLSITCMRWLWRHWGHVWSQEFLGITWHRREPGSPSPPACVWHPWHPPWDRVSVHTGRKKKKTGQGLKPLLHESLGNSGPLGIQDSWIPSAARLSFASLQSSPRKILPCVS